MDKKILELLEQDGRLTPKQLALMLSKEEGEIKALIEKYENEGVVLGYKAIIDWGQDRPRICNRADRTKGDASI